MHVNIQVIFVLVISCLVVTSPLRGRNDTMEATLSPVVETIRLKREVSNPNAFSGYMRTSFNNSHIHQPRINLTINNIFHETPPNVSALNEMFQFMLTTFDNTHVHQPYMNVTINNCI